MNFDKKPCFIYPVLIAFSYEINNVKKEHNSGHIFSYQMKYLLIFVIIVRAFFHML